MEKKAKSIPNKEVRNVRSRGYGVRRGKIGGFQEVQRHQTQGSIKVSVRVLVLCKVKEVKGRIECSTNRYNRNH